MMNSIIEEVKRRLNISENFVKAEKGTRSQVFLSDNFVIKINLNSAMLKNEGEVLGIIDLKIAPKFIDFFIIRDCGVLVEQRIKGLAIDDAWKDIEIANKKKIVADIAGAVNKINQFKKDYFWSAQFNERFKNYKDLLFYKFKANQKIIFENELAYKLFSEISNNIDEQEVGRVFAGVNPTLLHGDLIMHNILTDRNCLTGILDWEFAQFGDPFYDLARVVYYQECAKGYMDEEQDAHFEYDFTTRLIEQLKCNLEWSSEKYKIFRSFYFIDAIIWAVKSDDPKKNLSSLQLPRF